MIVYCLEEFKSQFEKLKKNNSYSDIEKEIIDYFFGKTLKDFIGPGRRLNGTDEVPFIKHRIKGRGGWRFYYLLIIKAGDLYLMYLHPKTGSAGADNLTNDFEKSIYKEVLSKKTSNDLYTVTVVEGKLKFTHNLLGKEDEKIMANLVKPIKAKNIEISEKIEQEKGSSDSQ